jgi:hypothetical protein
MLNASVYAVRMNSTPAASITTLTTQQTEHDPSGRECALAGRVMAGHDIDGQTACPLCLKDARFELHRDNHESTESDCSFCEYELGFFVKWGSAAPLLSIAAECE